MLNLISACKSECDKFNKKTHILPRIFAVHFESKFIICVENAHENPQIFLQFSKIEFCPRLRVIIF